MFYGLTSLGVFHTALSIGALATGVIALVKHHRITPDTRIGMAYIVLTIVVCLTGFGIFQHGGFGKPHMLGVVTLITLALSALAGRGVLFGGASPYVETVGYSLTLFFHMIPTLAESTTRLPYGAPLFPNPDVPELQAANAFCFLVFLVGAALQVRSLRRTLHPLPRFGRA